MVQKFEVGDKVTVNGLKGEFRIVEVIPGASSDKYMVLCGKVVLEVNGLQIKGRCDQVLDGCDVYR